MLSRDLTAALFRFVTFTQTAFTKLLMHSWSHYTGTNFKLKYSYELSSGTILLSQCLLWKNQKALN